MRDLQDQITRNILTKMGLVLDPTQLMELENTIVVEFHDYRITRESTDLVVYEDSNMRLLANYLVAKTIEGLSKGTLAEYSSKVKLYLIELQKPLKEVTTNDIRYYLAMYKKQRNVSGTTLNGIRRVLNQFFQWLTDEELIAKNPMRRIAPIKNDTFKKPAFSQTDLEKLNISCTNTRDRAMLEFLRSTGCRVSEVCSVNISDIDFHEMQLDVVGKGNKKRTVYLTEKAVLYLKIYLNSRDDNHPALFKSVRGSNRMTRNGIEQLLRTIGKRAGVTDCHPHRFRTTLCCTLLDRGVDVPHVQAILGHASINTTMIYYRYNKERTKSAFMLAAA